MTGVERGNDVQRPASKQTDQKDLGLNHFIVTTEINVQLHKQ